jgi:hypothetical protein
LTHSLKGAWFQPLHLKCDILVSKICAFTFNLCTTTPGFGYVPPVDDTPASEPPETHESSLLTDRTPVYDLSPALLNPPPQYFKKITPPIAMADLPFKTPGGVKTLVGLYKFVNPVDP